MKDAGKEAKVLVLTENEDIAELVSGVLAMVSDIQVRVVDTVDKIEGGLKGAHPKLIVLDLDWPHLFDPDVALVRAREEVGSLRVLPGLSSVPMIGLSAELSRNQMLSLGLAEALPKPFDVFGFAGMVERLVSGARQ